MLMARNLEICIFEVFKAPDAHGSRVRKSWSQEQVLEIQSFEEAGL